MFVKNYLLLTKPAFIWSKMQQKHEYYELCLLFKITVLFEYMLK